MSEVSEEPHADGSPNATHDAGDRDGALSMTVATGPIVLSKRKTPVDRVIEGAVSKIETARKQNEREVARATQSLETAVDKANKKLDAKYEVILHPFSEQVRKEILLSAAEKY